MSIETEIAALTTAATTLTSAVTESKAELDQARDAAAAQAAEATTQAQNAAASAQSAETARQGAVTAQNNAVAVVTGGTASLTAAAGKIPIADANGQISLGWIANTVLYTYPGNGAVSVVVNPTLNSNLGGFANVIAGGGALGNTQIINHGNYNTISGGYDNQTAPASAGASSSEANTIAGGAHHRMEAGVNHGTIMGGSYGLIKADVAYATIGGGSSHTITGMSGTVSGGAQNTAGRDATVGGGVVNTASGRYSTIAGGTLNTASADAATIAGGNGNTAAAGGFVGGGYQNNIAAGTWNIIVGGYQNVLGNTSSSNHSTIGGGRANSIQAGQYACIPGGYLNSVTADYGVATGTNAKAYLRGMVAHSAASSTSQLGSLHLYRQTTTATEADLLLDGGSAQFVIADNTLASFTIHVCAARTDVVGEYAWYLFRGVLKREGTAGSVQLLSSTLVDSFESTAAWNARLAANTGNGALRVAVTGEAGKTIRWSARLDLLEQKFA